MRRPTCPIVGVAAVIFNHAGKMCLVQRAQEPGKGSWSFPGGKLELGETLAEGLEREIREECSIEIEILTPQTPLCAIEKIGLDHPNLPHHYIVLDYLCRYVSGTLQASSDVSACEWVALNDLRHFTENPTTLWVAELAQKSFAQYERGVARK